MEDPVAEIESVVLKVTATHSPDVQAAAFQRYMSQDMGFRHPVCSIVPGPNSRNKVLGVYQWYRVLSPRIDIRIDSVVFDEARRLLYVEGVQWFKLIFLPVKPVPARLIIRLTLRKENNLFYIAFQEDF